MKRSQECTGCDISYIHQASFEDVCRDEALVTNLPEKSFDSQQIGELYHMRWRE